MCLGKWMPVDSTKRDAIIGGYYGTLPGGWRWDILHFRSSKRAVHETPSPDHQGRIYESKFMYSRFVVCFMIFPPRLFSIINNASV